MEAAAVAPSRAFSSTAQYRHVWRNGANAIVYRLVGERKHMSSEQ